jgi:hypothetical protein
MAVLQKSKVKVVGIWFVAFFLLATHMFLHSSLHADEVTIPPSAWQQVQTLSGDCSISFPSEPKLIQQSLDVSEQGHKLTYDVYLAPLSEKSLCLLLVATYPYSLKDGQELAGIEGLLNGILAQSPENKLLFANVVDQNGNPSVDFLIQSPSSYFRGQALMVGNKLYLMAIEGISEELDEKSFATFSQSFMLILQK